MFVDQYTKFVLVELLKAKSEAFASLKKFVLSVGTPKKLRQDNAKEFLSEQFKTYCLDAGIIQEEIIPETPQNGLAERCNRTLLEMARCLLIDSGLPKMMWGTAILHTARIRNLVVRRGEEKCPAELMRGIKPKLPISKLSIFGCTVFMRKRDREVRKLEPKALEGKFVGYTEGENGYLVYIPNTRKVMAVRDVIIKESEVGSIPDIKETADLLDDGSEAKQGDDWDLVATGNEGRGQGTRRQRDLEPSETTRRQGRHIGQVGLQSEIGSQWSSGQI